MTFGRLQHCTFITLVWVRSLQERYNGSLLYKSFTCRFSRRMSFSFPNHGRVFGGTFVQPVSSQRSIRPIQVVGDSACCRCTSLSWSHMLWNNISIFHILAYHSASKQQLCTIKHFCMQLLPTCYKICVNCLPNIRKKLKIFSWTWDDTSELCGYFSRTEL